MDSKAFHFMYMNGQCVVEWQGKRFHQAVELFEQVPGLKEQQNAVLAAQLVNFLMMGDEFEVIEDPQAFGDRYRQNLYSAHREDFHSSSYGVYDVSEIEMPFWKEGILHYYAESLAMGIPYRVDYDPGTDECRYQLLKS